MAPSTALLMMLIGLTVFLCGRRPGSQAASRFGYSSVGIVACTGLLVCARHWFGWNSPFEQWLAQTTDRIANIPVGQMSPLTGASFIVAALSLAFRLAARDQRSAARWISVLLALAVWLVGAGMLVSYAVGKPWLYGTGTIPMAIWTAIGFVAFGFALLAAPALAIDLPAGANGPSASLRPAIQPQAPRHAAVAVSIVLGLVISIVGALYLRSERTEIRREAGELLEAVGDMKVAQVVRWRGERLKDARFFAESDFVVREVEEFLNHSESAARARLLHSLAMLQRGDRYALVALFDTNVVLRLAVPAPTNLPPSEHHDLITRVLQSGKILMTGMGHDAAVTNSHLGILVPVFAPTASQGPPSSIPRQRGQPLGVVLLQLDPHQFLFPLLQSWPTPSRTAETLLVAREANEVVFLNPLRHQTTTALGLRFPIDPASSLPAVGAALGQTGQLEGRDYRNVPVLANVTRVPETAWHLVAKVDRDEIFGPLRKHAWETLALTAVLASLAGLISGFARKHREAAGTRLELAAERARLALAQRVEHLMKSANDAIILADAQDNILEANDRAQELYGFSLAELQSMKLPALRAPETRPEYSANARRMVANGQAVFATRHQRKDGSVFPVEISSSLIEIDGVRYKLGFLRDITQREAHEREIARMTRFYATLSQINQMIVRVHSREELFREVCRITLEYGGFKLVWVGWHDTETHLVKPLARAGQCDTYLDSIKVSTDDSPEGRGPVGTSIREGKACVFNDFLNDERAAAWHEAAVAHQLRAVVAVPIRFDGQVCGAFAVYADEPGVFQDKEIALLEETAFDISFALDHLAQEEKRAQAEIALGVSEAFTRTVLDNLPVGIAVNSVDPAVSFSYMNESFPRIYRTTRERLAGPDAFWSAVYEDPEFREVMRKRVLEDCASGEVERMGWADVPINRKGEGTAFITARNIPLPHKGLTISIVWDVTERKRTEAALRESEELYRTLVGASPDSISVTDLEGKIIYVSPKGLEMFGLASVAEASGRSMMAWISPSDHQLAVANIQHLLTEGQIRETEYSLLRKDGSLFSAEVNAGVLRAPDGSPKEMIFVTRDITERKRAQAQLRKLSLAVEQSPAAIVITNPAGDIEYVNPKFTELTGYTLAEARGQNPRILNSGATSPAEYRRLWQTISRGEVWRGEFQNRKKNGELFWEFASIAPVVDEAGRITHFLAVKEDITERKQAEEALRVAHERLRRFVDANIVGVVIANATGTILETNDYYLNLIGVTREELNQGKLDWRAITPPEWLPADEKAIQELRERGTCTPYEKEYVRRDGTRVPVFLADAMLPGPGEQIAAFVLDLTDRKRAEAALDESERRLYDMMENVQMITIMLDDCGQVFFCNEYLLNLTGWQKEEVLGRDYFEIFIPADVRDKLRQVYQTLMEGSPLSHNENEIITRSGERRLISWNNSSLKDMAGRTIGVASIGEDITERKRLEAQLRQAQKMEAIGQLAGGVAHDFNNILAATMMQLGFLQERSDLDGEMRESLADLVSHAERAASLTRQLLLFSRRSVMQVHPLDLNEAVESLLKMLRRIIGEQIDLDWRGKAQLPEVSADAGMMDQVIMNLVVNARDAMPGGGRITIATEAVEVGDALAKVNPDARAGHFVCLSVADNGCGMDETILKRIFEPFFTTKETGKGTGLGLATVYGIAKQHHGWVTVESGVGIGSTFRIYLPVVAGHACDTMPLKTVQPVQTGNETILLVEDDPSVRKTIRAFLRHFGYEVIEAASGLEAFTLWEAHQAKIALLFTDMVMPNGLSGLQLAEKMRAVKPELKVIISSGYSADLLQESDLAGKGIVFLRKPCPSSEMAAAVRGCLDRS